MEETILSIDVHGHVAQLCVDLMMMETEVGDLVGFTCQSKKGHTGPHLRAGENPSEPGCSYKVIWTRDR